jgi:hypothetical protein
MNQKQKWHKADLGECDCVFCGAEKCGECGHSLGVHGTHCLYQCCSCKKIGDEKSVCKEEEIDV